MIPLRSASVPPRTEGLPAPPPPLGVSGMYRHGGGSCCSAELRRPGGVPNQFGATSAQQEHTSRPHGRRCLVDDAARSQFGHNAEQCQDEHDDAEYLHLVQGERRDVILDDVEDQTDEQCPEP